MTSPVDVIVKQIRGLGPEGARALLTAIEGMLRADPEAPRCPSTHNGMRCVRDEDHIAGHVASNGEEWTIAMRCHIGAPRGILGTPICSRLQGHEGPCEPLPQPVRLPDPLPEPRKRRGFCWCGRSRQEHAGLTHTGGCEATGCKRYAP